MAKSSKINVQGVEISITSHNNEDYICLTDMLKAKDWREANPERHLKGENIREMASINELAILSNLESLNYTLIK